MGTLRYTRRGLLVLALWLLGGDFAFVFFESIFSRFMPLYLKDLHASNALIGIMTGSFAGIVNILFLPQISQWSDRHRGRFGRRIPFLLAVAPLTVASLVGVGFAPEIAAWLQAHAPGRLAAVASETTVVLSLLCVFVVSFHFFNMVLVNAYGWLLRDVVPQELMARFLSWFRIVGTASTFCFLWIVFPHMEAHRKGIFAGIGLFYLAAFLLMCAKVREGTYPEMAPGKARPGLLQSFLPYFKECLRFPIYRHFFAASVLGVLATACAGPFAILFARETLGFDMDSMGKLLAWGAAASAAVYFPMGWLCDRFGALRVALLALVVLVLVSLLALFLVHGQRSYLIYTVVWALPTVGWTLGSYAAMMKLFPKEKFGQFSSASNVFGCGALIVGNYAIGRFIDLVHGDYRMTFLWSAVLFALAIYPMSLVYRYWKQHGGPDNYVPPLPEVVFPPKASHS
ncbi:MFS-type transporter involved in bile tolerance, Atg22 family [Verrucomicrobium sp. GAS474]|uniref:MFS transporter n=1 Tax=Verrucomicrobium sp. GAS474 TaxID=1882831 RepID=UPI0008793DCF|nr:MFS transporter [Verrucomicrobium sp. GAS474]SDT89164.1 MFS-type transporter involved in bile tolerance, Atg22 family [Verrucomicrobium sp. GAS474]